MYKSGDVILVGLLPLHVRTSDDKCGEFFRYGLDYVEAMIYAVKQINSNDKILPNVTIGYDIRDFCDSPSLAMMETYDIATNNHITRLFQKYKNGTTEGRCDLGCFGPTGSPVVAIIGPVDSSSCLVVASLLKVVQIPAITAFATSEELSTGFDSFFRTVPSDNQQVKAMADIIDHFNWSYVGVIAVDHSYGRYALRALEHEVATRRTFCIAMTGYFPQSGYEDKIQHIIASLKQRENVRVIILWSTYTPGLRVIQEAANQKLHGRTWLISEGLAMQGPGFFGEEEQHVVDGFIGILHPKFKDKSLEEYLR
jgi:metabotropic glutamate receptor 6/7/8